MISGVMKEMWPAMIVQKPGSILAEWKMTSSEIPRTSPGSDQRAGEQRLDQRPPSRAPSSGSAISARRIAAQAEIKTATNATLRL